MSKFYEEEALPRLITDPTMELAKNIIDFYGRMKLKNFRVKKKEVRISYIDPKTGDMVSKMVIVGDPTLSQTEKLALSKELLNRGDPDDKDLSESAGLHILSLISDRGKWRDNREDIRNLAKKFDYKTVHKKRFVSLKDIEKDASFITGMLISKNPILSPTPSGSLSKFPPEYILRIMMNNDKDAIFDTRDNVYVPGAFVRKRLKDKIRFEGNRPISYVDGIDIIDLYDRDGIRLRKKNPNVDKDIREGAKLKIDKDIQRGLYKLIDDMYPNKYSEIREKEILEPDGIEIGESIIEEPSGPIFEEPTSEETKADEPVFEEEIVAPLGKPQLKDRERKRLMKKFDRGTSTLKELLKLKEYHEAMDKITTGEENKIINRMINKIDNRIIKHAAGMSSDKISDLHDMFVNDDMLAEQLHKIYIRKTEKIDRPLEEDDPLSIEWAQEDVRRPISELTEALRKLKERKGKKKEEEMEEIIIGEKQEGKGLGKILKRFNISTRGIPLQVLYNKYMLSKKNRSPLLSRGSLIGGKYCLM